MQHRNAPLTPLGRRRLVALVEDDGLTFEAAAAASNVSRSTAQTWVTRWRQAGGKQRRDLTCLRDRSSAPATARDAERRYHDRVCEERRRTGWGPRLIASELGIPHATVSGHCAGAAARGDPQRQGGGAPLRVALPRRPAADGHQALRPLRGARSCGDRERTRGPEAERAERVAHTMVDDRSRLAYTELHPDERGRPSPASWSGRLVLPHPGIEPRGCRPTTPGPTRRTAPRRSC